MSDDPHASGFDFSKATVKADTPWDRLPKAEEAVVAKPSELDSEENVDLHKRLSSYYVRELARQEDNRYQMALDEEFYDNNQWNETDKQTLKDRGQVPIVYNVLAPTINWILGTEKRSRTDFKILPRRKDGSKPAERKTQLMKYLADVNRSQFSKSRAFEDAVKAGVGWLECGVQDDDDSEPVYDRTESWRNILWDSASVEADMSDCRYMIRQKWADVDIAKAMFGGRKAIIDQSAIDSSDFALDLVHGDEAMDAREIADGYWRDNEGFAYARKRVRLIEVWYRAPVKVSKLHGGEFSGQVYDEDHPAHAEQVQAGHSVVVSKMMMRMHVAILCVKGMLFVSQTPYRHNSFPFTPIWCNRRGKTGLPYGIIRGLRDIQSDVNKRASKALHILSTSKTIMDEGAVPDLEAFEEEVARPDAIIIKKQGKQLELNADRELAPAHLELMSRSISMIQSVSGVTDENMGRTTNARSGIAIQARQTQGSLTTAGLFDNLRFANQCHGEKELSLIEQYFTDAKNFRITNMRGTPEYITVNDGLPENDIVRTKADFVISEDDWRMSVRQAQTAELLELLQQLAPVAPQIALIMLDLLVEAMDIPNRDEIVHRIRQATGMRDPDQEEPTPDDIQKAQDQAKQKQMAEAMQAAELAEKQASAALKGAQAGKLQSDAEISAQTALAAIANQNVQSQIAALQAALAMLQAPHTVPVADGVLHEAGFVSRSEKEDEASLQAAMQAKAAQAQQAQAEQIAQAQQAAQAQQGPQPQPRGIFQ
jgi:hypothetical protein